MTPRRTFYLCFAALLALTGCAGDPPSPSAKAGPAIGVRSSPEEISRPDVVSPTPDEPSREPAPVPQQFSTKGALRHVRYLAGEIGVRVRAAKGELLGARYAASKFRAYGYDVKIQKFSVDGGTSRNVVASWPDSKRYPVVVGGHMDSVPGAPGANDNASGTAVVLELARVFARTRQALFTKFVAFGSEELGEDGSHHVGSEVFVRRLGREGRRRLAGMVSVDMIADGRPLLVGNSEIADDRVADSLYRRVQKRGIDVRRTTLCDCSDHGPFEHAGISAAFAYSGPTDYYHSNEDTLNKVRSEDLQRAGQAIKAFIKAFDASYLAYLRSR